VILFPGGNPVPPRRKALVQTAPEFHEAQPKRELTWHALKPAVATHEQTREPCGLSPRDDTMHWMVGGQDDTMHWMGAGRDDTMHWMIWDQGVKR